LGYTLFDSPDNGRVDSNAELTSISQKVEEEGATMATFWDVQSVFNRLRDGHVTMPKTNADLGTGYLFFIPERCADSAMKGKHSFLNDPVTGELQLKIHWEDGDGTRSESVVESMNGGSPYEFFLNASNSPSIVGIPYQSRGARFNALLMIIGRNWDEFSWAFGDYSKAILPVFVNARPSAAYPQEVLVKYADGKEEMYRASFLINSIGLSSIGGLDSFTELNENNSTMKFDVPIIQDHINEVGSSYNLVQKAVKNATTAFNIKSASPTTKNEDINVVRNVEKEPFWFQTYPSDQPKVAGKIMNAYAIFKIESFDLAPNYVIGAWNALSTKCKEAGVKKLIVDISNNPGGDAENPPTLATLMYPSAAYGWHRRNHAVVINKPMQIYRDVLEPEFDIFDKIIQSNETDEVLQRDVIDKLTDDRVKQVDATFAILKWLCDQLQQCREGDDDCLEHHQLKCNKLEFLQGSWEIFATNKSVPLLKLGIEDMVNGLLKEFNRFGGLQQEMDFNETRVRRVNQGGVLTNLTNSFTLFTEDHYSMAVANALENDPAFDEYIVVSNGVAGSASALFASEVEQLWKNKDKSLVKTKLTTVSYGGLKEDNGDVTMAGFPATREVVHIEDTFITSGVALLLASLIPKNFTVLSGFSSALDEYYNSFADPPYFANTLPKMPVIGYYDSFMGPDAMPLQYVEMPADKQIPSYYFGTKIQDNSDLEELYKKTAEFFSSDLAAGDEGKVENSDIVGGNASTSENESSEEGSGSDPVTASAPSSNVENSDIVGGNASTSENDNSEEGSGSVPEIASAPSSIAAARVFTSGLVSVVAVVAAAVVLFSFDM
jgi:hypothetical protein